MSTRFSSLRCLVVALTLHLLLPRIARSEGTASYKFQSWQEDNDRIRVDSHYGLLEDVLPGETKIKVMGVIDAISGATPTGQLTPDVPGGGLPMTQIEDRRKAWNLEASRNFSHTNIALGYANSRESDYVSNGWSLNTQTDFNQKNTTFLAGIAGTDDKVKVFFQQPWEKKRSVDFITGLTQLVDPDTSLSFNLGYGHSSGFLSDPYKLIEKHVDLGDGLILLRNFGENRPGQRDKWTALATVNHAFRPLNAAVEASYRYYHDDFGINSHTLSLEWFQKLFHDRLMLRPLVRFYEQSAASFYRLTLDGTSILPQPGQPNPNGPFYSADFRLSKMSTVDLGIRAVVTILPDRLTFDVSYDRYSMHGRDGMTSASAYAKANMVTVGATYNW